MRRVVVSVKHAYDYPKKIANLRHEQDFVLEAQKLIFR